MNNLETSITYANDCINDIIPTCNYTKLACKRFLNDLESPNYYYDKQAVDTVVKFINFFYLTESFKKQKFILQDWQTFIISNLYGIKRRDNKKRKYKYAYIELARKNGKTQLVAALALYHLITDADAQVVVSANSLRQAKEVDFDKLKILASQIDRKQKHIIHYYNSLKFNSSKLIVTASDSSRLDGLNASMCIIDEFHAAPDNSMYNVLKSSMGSRPEPLLLVITTAGFKIESFCYSLRSYIVDILYDQKTDEQQFGIIYTVGDEDEINLENVNIWDIAKKANPNLNISVNIDYLESELNKADNNATERAGVLVKFFNKWLKSNTTDVWIEEQYFLQALQPIRIEDMKGRECIVGIDLASVSDVTSMTFYFPPTASDYNHYFFNRYYLPEDNLNTNVNRQMFKEAAALGEITITEGNVVDYQFILKDLQLQDSSTPVQMIYYDNFNSTQFIIDCTEASYNTKPVSQSGGFMNEPLKQFERHIKRGEIIIEKNSITKKMLNAVVIDIDRFGNYKLDRKNRSRKIDGVASILDAYGGCMKNPTPNYEIV